MAQLFLNGQSLGPIDGVLFDKDGTLSRSEPDLLNLVKRRMDIAERLWSEQCLDIQPNRPARPYQLRTLLQQVYGVQGETIHPAGTLAVAARQDNFTSMATVFCLMGSSWPQAVHLTSQCFEQDELGPRPCSALLEGVKDLLAQCQNADVCAAVISNDTTAGIAGFLDRHQLNDHFASCWSADDSPRKPDPVAVLTLCKRLGVRPERCALVGDADTDLHMAEAAGIGIVLGYQGGWQRPPDLLATPHLFHDWSALKITSDP